MIPFPIPSSWKLYVAVGGGVFLLTAFGLGYAYFRWSQSELGRLNTAISEMTARAAALEAVAAEIRSDFTRMQQAQDELNRSISAIRSQAARDAAAIRNSVRQGTPQEIERRANEATGTMLRRLEELSRDAP